MLLSRDCQTPSATSQTDRKILCVAIGWPADGRASSCLGGFWSEEGVSGFQPFHPGAEGETKAGKELMLSLREMRHS